MTDIFKQRIAVAVGLGAAICAVVSPAYADSAPAVAASGDPAGADTPAASGAAPAGDAMGSHQPMIETGGRLLLTGGVSTIEGAGGGGLVPWALIGGYGTRDEVGMQAFTTAVGTTDYHLLAYGASVNLFNRVEVSLARQNFDTRSTGALLGLGNNFIISQTIIGAKVRLIGDAVLDQNSLLPQIAVGVEHKINDDTTVVGGALGLKRSGTDYYVAATKLLLSENLLLNATLRLTDANQYGLLGFGGLGHTDQALKAEFEGSAAYLVTRKLAFGGEVRTKPNQLEGALGGTTFKEQTAWDVFAAYALNRHVSVTAAYVDLGQIALRTQHAAYLSLQFGF
jgi:hypothetical protein